MDAWRPWKGEASAQTPSFGLHPDGKRRYGQLGQQDAPSTYRRRPTWIGSRFQTKSLVRALAILLTSLVLSTFYQLFFHTHDVQVGADVRDTVQGLGASTDFWAFHSRQLPSEAQLTAYLRRIEQGPIRTEEVPKRHSKPLLGLADMFTGPQRRCTTYRGRFERYTDRALGFTYRRSRGRAVLGFERDHGIVQDPLHGPRRPEDLISSRAWSGYLKQRNIGFNANLTHDELAAIPNWRAIVDLHRKSQGRRTYRGAASTGHRRPTRTAIVLRFYEGYVLTEDEVLNTRAMVAELSLSTSSRDLWDIRIMVETKETVAAFASHNSKEQILMPMMPRELWDLVEFWSENFARLLLPKLECGRSGVPRSAYNQDRACIMASQLFSLLHPEYDFVYNWEADLRFLGHFSLFFDTVEAFARNEPLDRGMQKYASWLIPGSQRSEQTWFGDRTNEEGRGREADLIVFNPLFDVAESGWYHRNDAQNIGLDTPRRGSIVSSLRMSRNLLLAMNLAAAEHQRSMACEAWPVTATLHTQFPPSDTSMYPPNATFLDELDFPLKAVFVPHPVYFSNQWSPRELEDHLWIPRFMTFAHEDFMQETTYYYASLGARPAYVDWKEARGVGACREPALMHPIKNTHLLSE